jgi:hypothetical protein
LLRFKEKGGKEKELPVHHKLEELLDEYLKVTDLVAEPGSPLFPAAPLGNWKAGQNLRQKRTRGISVERRKYKNVFWNSIGSYRSFPFVAPASRLAERRKSIVAPVESTARYKYTHLPLTRTHVSSTRQESFVALTFAQAPIQLRGVPLNPAPDVDVIRREPTLGQ